jgi:hypothetical protein
MNVETSDLLTGGGFAALAGLLIVEMRILRSRMEILIAALFERARIRDERKRRESSLPPMLPRAPAGRQLGRSPADDFAEEESTDIHVLMDRERARRKTGRHERKPRPGTHHDSND